MKLPRMLDWWIVAMLLAGIIVLVAPHQLPVTLYKLSLVALAGVVGYRLDRSLFPYARPDRYLMPPVSLGGPQAPAGHLVVIPGCEAAFAAAMQRRALIIAACIIGVSLGA